MTPKFRGGSDDWLDDEDSSRGSGASKKKKAGVKGTTLLPEDANATVAEVFPNQCRVRFDDGMAVLCTYRRSKIFGTLTLEYRERAPVAVGDRVKVESVTQVGAIQEGVVSGVAARKNKLARPSPDRGDESLHVIAANVDALVIVAAATQPEFSPGLIDRFLIAADLEKIPTIICISKIDLLPPATELERPWSVYEKLGVSVYETCSKKNIGVDEIRKDLVGKTVIFAGHSGVGKTSLMRALLGAEIGKIGEVSEFTGKGRHTTSSAVLLEENGTGSRWIDTPGVRAFGLVGVTPEKLKDCYPELRSLACSAHDCSHTNEEDCVARDLPRYGSYARIYQSLKDGEY